MFENFFSSQHKASFVKSWGCLFYYQAIIVYYVPGQVSRCLYEDVESNVRVEGEDGRTASEYKQFDCL